MKDLQCWLMKTIFLKGDKKRLAKDTVPDTAEFYIKTKTTSRTARKGITLTC